MMDNSGKTLSQNINKNIKGWYCPFGIKCLITTWIIVSGIFPSHVRAAQINNNLNIDGEVRLRYELTDGFNDRFYGETPSAGENMPIGHTVSF